MTKIRTGGDPLNLNLQSGIVRKRILRFRHANWQVSKSLFRENFYLLFRFFREGNVIRSINILSNTSDLVLYRIFEWIQKFEV